jgi:hypothetical protein
MRPMPDDRRTSTSRLNKLPLGSGVRLPRALRTLARGVLTEDGPYPTVELGAVACGGARWSLSQSTIDPWTVQNLHHAT